MFDVQADGSLLPREHDYRPRSYPSVWLPRPVDSAQIAWEALWDVAEAMGVTPQRYIWALAAEGADILKRLPAVH